MYDLLIRGATVVDGLGHDPRRADVAITNSRIAAIGEIGSAAAESWHGSCSKDRQVRAFALCAGPIRAGIAGSHPDLIPGPALCGCSDPEQMCEIRAS